MRHSFARPLALLALAFLTACESEVSTPPAEDESAAAESSILVHQVYDAFASGDDAVVDSVFAENFVEHEQLPGLSPDRDGVKAFIGMWRSAFPDLEIEVHHVITQGDMTAAHATFRGTHRGEFMGIAPTGREIAVPTIDIIRFENGRAVEHWGVTNEAVLMRQLGLLPEAEGAVAPEGDAPTDSTR